MGHPLCDLVHKPLQSYNKPSFCSCRRVVRCPGPDFDGLDLLVPAMCSYELHVGFSMSRVRDSVYVMCNVFGCVLYGF